MVLKRGTGSCSEYNYVLSGLCRLAGLPTRYVGGSTNGFRPFPTTDAVFHRWTEVFLAGVGWFPVDCSRDANPIRGKRSHFGRYYTDVLVWCRQGGGPDDFLEWEYRANARVKGEKADVFGSHRTRWFEFIRESELKKAYAWLAGKKESAPEADALECALLFWGKTSGERRKAAVRALAEAGRNEALRRAALLELRRKEKKRFLESLCATEELARTLLEKSRNPYLFRNWFRRNERNLAPAGGGRFRLRKQPGNAALEPEGLPASEVWIRLARGVVKRFPKVESASALAVMPPVDHTRENLGKLLERIHRTLKTLFPRETGVVLVDEELFNRYLADSGPGEGEFWLYSAHEPAPPHESPPSGFREPDYIVVPVCTVRNIKGEKFRTLELKVLEVAKMNYFKVISQARYE